MSRSDRFQFASFFLLADEAAHAVQEFALEPQPVLQYQETVGLITALCYEEEKNYLEAMIQRGNRGIVGHVIETSTVEASTVTVLLL